MVARNADTAASLQLPMAVVRAVHPVHGSGGKALVHGIYCFIINIMVLVIGGRFFWNIADHFLVEEEVLDDARFS